MFSTRTNWHRQYNRLTQLLETRLQSGNPVYDLTVSDPTDVGIRYPKKKIVTALTQPPITRYAPDPRGLLSARESVAQYYRERNIIADVSRIFLTASTSESYSFIFKLLCNAGESVLVPQPSYPLFEYLATVSDVQLQHYFLHYDHGWGIDFDSMSKAISPSTRAIILINPHSPTGLTLTREAFHKVREMALSHNVAVLIDEVFADYRFQPGPKDPVTQMELSQVLTFTLNGISKTIGLPQMKLGWIIVDGPTDIVHEATDRLEILCDTFLSVNTPVQLGLPALFESGKSVRGEILDRITSNYDLLRRLVSGSSCSVLESEGGWYAVIRVPRIKSDEAWAVELLQEFGIFLYPGYFFDFHDEGYLVISLIVAPETFQISIENLVRYTLKR